MLNRKTLGKDLNQEKLEALIDSITVDQEAFNEILEDWQERTLEVIIREALEITNNLFMDEVFEDYEVIEVNNLIIELRKSL